MTLAATPLPSPPPPIPEEDAETQLVDRASAGARLLTARGVGMRVVSVASNLALLALVTPADLGLLAVVRGLTALAGNTTDLGFAWALLRRQARTRLLLRVPTSTRGPTSRQPPAPPPNLVV